MSDNRSADNAHCTTVEIALQPHEPLWPDDRVDTTPSGHKRCKARAKRRIADGHVEQARCKNPVVPGMEVCFMHGGRVGIGVAKKQFTTGDRSRHLPPALAEIYRSMMDRDEAGTSLQHQLHLLETHIAQLTARLDGAPDWNTLKAASLALEIALTTKDEQQIANAFQQVKALAHAAVADEEVWEQIRAVSKDKAKVANVEWRRLAEREYMLRADEALDLIRELMFAVKEHVKDQVALNAIAARIGAKLQTGLLQYQRKVLDNN